MNWVAPIKDDDTLRLFCNALKEVDIKYYIMFELGVGTGLQLQNILSFKVKDVQGKYEINVEIGTRKVKNTFYIPEGLRIVIDRFTNGKNPDSYLFVGHTSSSNKPISREQAYRVFRAAGHSIGLNSIGAQTMRKTFAWKYYKQTGDIYYLQAMFNHASPSITYRFIGEKPNMQVVLKKMTPQENERSRYILYLNGNGKRRLNAIIDSLTDIREHFDDPMNNDSFYGKIDCLLVELESLMKNYRETK
jgi:integrase